MANNANNQEQGSNLLAWSAARAAKWPHLFSNLIERYLELNNLSEVMLCARLHCDQHTLNHLRLCGRPDPDPSAFALDVQRVADKLGLNAGTLASIVREVDAAEAFGRAGRNPSVGSWPSERSDANSGSGQTISPFSSTPGMLKAARDRDEESRVEDQGSDVEVEAGDGGEFEAQESERQGEDDNGT